MTGPPRIPLAVALRYDAPDAPRVVAVGRGEIGERIIEAARQNEIPLESNAPLAEALSRVELDTEIPPQLYGALATILAFIIRASAMPPTAPGPHHR